MFYPNMYRAGVCCFVWNVLQMCWQHNIIALGITSNSTRIHIHTRAMCVSNDVLLVVFVVIFIFIPIWPLSQDMLPFSPAVLSLICPHLYFANEMGAIFYMCRYRWWLCTHFQSVISFVDKYLLYRASMFAHQI